MKWLEFSLPIAVACISSGGLQYFFNWKARSAELEKTTAETNKLKTDAIAAAVTAEENRRELLAAAQLVAQQEALESASGRYAALREDYDECRSGLREVRVAAFTLIDVVEMLLARFTRNGDKYAGELSAKDFRDARSAIVTAREHLNK